MGLLLLFKRYLYLSLTWLSQPDLKKESSGDFKFLETGSGREGRVEMGGRIIRKKRLVNIFPFSYIPPTYCKNQSPLSFCSACVNV